MTRGTKVRVFLSMHWEGNDLLRTWFRQNMEALGLEVVEGGRPSTHPVPHEIDQLIQSSDLLVAVLTRGSRSFVDQEIGFSRARRLPMLVFFDVSESTPEEMLRGVELYTVVSCPFHRDRLELDGHRIISAIRENAQSRNNSYLENVGFIVEESRTEVRFFDWRDLTHSEVYEKWLRLRPLRDGDLIVNTKSGSTAWREPNRSMIQSTHRFSTRDISDGYHVMTQATVRNAIKGQIEELFESSERIGVPNTSRDCIHPEFAGYSADSYWCVVFHVLYRTDFLRFRARFAPNQGIDPRSVRVLHQAHGNQVEDVGSDIRMVGDGGTLQYLRWDRPHPEEQTDYLVIWKWA